MFSIRSIHALAWVAAVLVGCGGGGASGKGSVAVSLKDAPSDHIASFQVDVTSVNLVSQDGLEVAVLPGKKRLDLARLVTVSQLLAVAAVPGGIYTSLAITFDMSQASVLIDGNAQSASLLDTSGNPLSGLVTRSLDMKSKPIACEQGLTRFVEIDFDLDASCVIDVAANRVTLGPVLKADFEPSNPVDTQIAGILAKLGDGQGASGNFSMELGPPGSLGSGLPEVRVTTSQSTQFFVNGKPGAFQDLKTIPIGAPIFARGQLSASRDTLVATRVDTGTPQDMVEGVVVSRTTDGTLTVAGRSVAFPADTVTIGTFTLAAQTAPVLIPTPAQMTGEAPPPSPTPLGQNAIGVGQRLEAHGKLSGTTLDASQGVVLLGPTPVFGLAKGPAANGLLTVEVQRIAMLPVSAFDFLVGNTTTAAPSNFVVSTGTLNVATITSGTPMAAFGTLAPWNAPSSAPNMTALGVADRTNVSAVLQCAWSTPTSAPFASLAGGGFVLDLSGAALKQVDTGEPTPGGLAATDRPQGLPGGGPDPIHFLIVQKGTFTDHADMASFTADCASRLASSGRVQSINAVGQWNRDAKSIVARQIVVSFE